MPRGKSSAEYAGVQIGTGPSGEGLGEGAIVVTVDGKDVGIRVRRKGASPVERPQKLFDGAVPEPNYFASEPE